MTEKKIIVLFFFDKYTRKYSCSHNQPLTIFFHKDYNTPLNQSPIMLLCSNNYHNIRRAILNNLCSDVWLGHDFLIQHERVEIPFPGYKPTFSLCSLPSAKFETQYLFRSLYKSWWVRLASSYCLKSLPSFSFLGEWKRLQDLSF